MIDAPSLITGDNKISNYPDDTTFSIEQVIKVVCSEQKVTLPFGGTGPNKELPVTLTGYLKTIYSSEHEDYVNTVEKFINHYREKLSNAQKSITLHHLFSRGGTHIEAIWNLMSQSINKVEIGGIVFIKDLEQPGLESIKTYNLLAVFNTIDNLTQITQQGVNSYCMPGYVSGWTIQ